MMGAPARGAARGAASSVTEAARLGCLPDARRTGPDFARVMRLRSHSRLMSSREQATAIITLPSSALCHSSNAGNSVLCRKCPGERTDRGYSPRSARNRHDRSEPGRWGESGSGPPPGTPTAGYLPPNLSPHTPENGGFGTIRVSRAVSPPRPSPRAVVREARRTTCRRRRCPRRRFRRDRCAPRVREPGATTPRGRAFRRRAAARPVATRRAGPHRWEPRHHRCAHSGGLSR